MSHPDVPRGTATPRVSVVVPVWNAGRYLDRCVSSLLAQTLPQGELELVFVDDGSTDGSSGVLDRLAAEHAHVRVIHEPNSGWAGRPRNVGIGAATGHWIQFVDQDDQLGKDALRRLTELGDSSGADIVLGKVRSDWRPVNHDVFRTTRRRATLLDSPLIQSLTPHKMFRRAFLLEHDLRFPEGTRRLEDQLFMVRSYLAARSVAILADYPCYFYLRRDDGGNAGSTPIDPAAYYRDLEEVLDAVEAGTEPGPLRDRMLSRFLRSEVLNRVMDAVDRPAGHPFRESVLEVTQEVVRRRFPADVQTALPAVDRAAARLLIAGEGEALAALRRRTEAIRLAVTLDDVRWNAGRWRLHLSARLCDADGSPLELVRSAEGGWSLDLGLLAPDGAPMPLDVTADVGEATIATLSIRRGSRLTWFVPTQWARTLLPSPDGGRATLSFTGTAIIDPASQEGQQSWGRGAWDIHVRVRAFGLGRSTGVAVSPRLGATLIPAVVGPVPQVVRLFATQERHRLAVDVGEARAGLPDSLPGLLAGEPTVDTDGRLDVPLAVATSEASPALPATVVLRRGRTRGLSVSARFEPVDGGVRLRTDPLAASSLSNGRWRVDVRTPHGEGAALGRAIVRDGRVTAVRLGASTARRLPSVWLTGMRERGRRAVGRAPRTADGS